MNHFRKHDPTIICANTVGDVPLNGENRQITNELVSDRRVGLDVGLSREARA
jgi:hypothetical protein